MAKLSEAQRQDMRRDYANGIPLAVISMRYGVSRATVSKSAARHGLAGREPPRWSDEKTAKLREMAAAGQSARQIAEHLGMTRRAVIGRAYRLKISLGGRPGRPAKSTKAAAKPAIPTKRELAVAAIGTAPVANLPAVIPMTFDEATDRGRCLFYAGDPYGPSGPEMPVCGAERLQGDPRVRYCPRHVLLQYQPKALAA